MWKRLVVIWAFNRSFCFVFSFKLVAQLSSFGSKYCTNLFLSNGWEAEERTSLMRQWDKLKMFGSNCINWAFSSVFAPSDCMWVMWGNWSHAGCLVNLIIISVLRKSTSRERYLWWWSSIDLSRIFIWNEWYLKCSFRLKRTHARSPVVLSKVYATSLWMV